ncbi:MAG: type II secretion system protein, partial [Phycisphaerales bacterium]|nr:type II secretion system protein [Phycisphaerales bacterium]
RAFTLVELLVVISIIALLVGILLPAISRARDNAQVGQAKSNIRNVHTACNLYSNDHKGKQWIGAPEMLSAGPDGSWTGMTAQNALNNWANRYHVSQTGGAGTKATIFPGIAACETDGGGHWYSTAVDNVAPYLFDSGLTTSVNGLARTGSWRATNTRQIAEYMEDKCYHKAYWSPKDRVITRELQQCWDGNGTMCSTTLIDGSGVLDIPLLLQPSSYSWSPANMMNCYVFEKPVDGNDPQDHFHDPMSFAAGFRAPTMSQAKFSSQKTYLMEVHWLQNLTTGECGANWSSATAAPYHVPAGDGNDSTWSYDGCYPHYFNASWRSMPVASMCDGSVTGLSTEIAEKHDYVVAGQNGSTGDTSGYDGLWHRGGPNAEMGFFVECRSDWGQWSGHTHTTGGMCEGRDLLAED